MPKVASFIPENLSKTGLERVSLGIDEYEVVRLIDLENLDQIGCANRMNISRATVARMYKEARNKIADALVNGKRLAIEGGTFHVCLAPRPECMHSEHCCHNRNKEENIRKN